jgi:peptidoglycan hydrolase CwlO-like protein
MLKLQRTKKPKNKMKKSSALVRKFTSRSALIVTAALLVLAVPLVHADTIQQQIDALNAQNSQAQSTVSSLSQQASSYQQAINILQSQIDGIQQAIQASENQQAQLQSEIQADETKLTQEKQVLGQDIKAQYVQGQLSTIEMLATSKSISTFVDSQVYQQALANQIQQTLTSISNIENQQKDQEKQVAALLATQDQQEAQLSSAQAQQSQLLAYNQSQQDQFTAQIQVNSAKINSLRTQQAAAERSAFAGSSSSTGGSVVYSNLSGQQLCGGGYNFHCGDGQDNYLDQWGEYNRECVSYAAWYEGSQGHYVPAFGYTVYSNGPQGNAYQWHGVISNTGAADIIYYDQALANESSLTGDVVYMPIGSLGHVGVVLSDEGNGWVKVGQYNLYDEGMYSTMDLKITSNLEFYHFH